MKRVTGIGGFFFPARDPEQLAKWYTTHFGIDPVPGDYDTPSWRQLGGPTVFQPFPQDTRPDGTPDRQWILNLRVSDLDGLAADLRAAGIEVAVEREPAPNGRFARLTDPEGNPIELWQPAGRDAEAMEKD